MEAATKEEFDGKANGRRLLLRRPVARRIWSLCKTLRNRASFRNLLRLIRAELAESRLQKLRKLHTTLLTLQWSNQ